MDNHCVECGKIIPSGSRAGRCGECFGRMDAELLQEARAQALNPQMTALQDALAQLIREVQSLKQLRKAEIQDRAEFPTMHDGKRVIGKIPICGSGRALLVLKTGTRDDSFELAIM